MNEFFNSEIFGEYARIALEKGLIKKEAQDASKKPNPRYDSLDLEAIEMLYGIKPNGEDEKHIVEQAHPEPVVVAPAYDRVNGLVENQLERQDIMVGIALKPNDGKLVQRRYVVAHDELLNELLKTAFMLDKKGEEDLMKLADSCAGRLSNEQMVKVAFSWQDIAEAVGVTGGAAGIGYLATVLGASGPVGWGIGAAVVAVALLVNNFSDYIDRGVVENCDNSIAKLERILDDTDEAKGLDDEISAMIDEISTVRDIGREAMESSVELDSEEDIEQGKIIVKKYFAAVKSIIKKIPGWQRMLSAAGKVGDVGGDTYTGFGAGLYSVLERGIGAIVSSDVDKAVKALGTLKGSLVESKKNLMSLYKSTKAYFEDNKESIEDMIEEEMGKESGKEKKDEAEGLTEKLIS